MYWCDFLVHKFTLQMRRHKLQSSYMKTYEKALMWIFSMSSNFFFFQKKVGSFQTVRTLENWGIVVCRLATKSMFGEVERFSKKGSFRDGLSLCVIKTGAHIPKSCYLSLLFVVLLFFLLVQSNRPVPLSLEMSLRYQVAPADAVELLSKTLYQSAPYEYGQKDGWLS